MTFRVRSLAPLLVVALAVAACSGTSSASPGTSPPPSASMPEASASAAPPASGSAAICTDAAAFRASVTALTDLKLADVGVSGVTAALAAVQSSAQALRASGKDLVAQPASDLLTAVQGSS